MFNNIPSRVELNMSIDNLPAVASAASSEGSTLDSSTDRCSSPETSVSDASSNASLLVSSPDTDKEVHGKKNARTSYTKAQTQTLLKIFNENPYPDAEMVENIGNDLGLSENKIKIWFQNRHARTRRKVNVNNTHLQQFGVPDMMSPMTTPMFPYGYLPMPQMFPSQQFQHAYNNGYPWMHGPNNNQPVYNQMSAMINNPRLQSVNQSASKADNQITQLSSQQPSCVGNRDLTIYPDHTLSTMSLGNTRDATQHFHRQSPQASLRALSAAYVQNRFAQNNC